MGIQPLFYSDISMGFKFAQDYIIILFIMCLRNLLKKQEIKRVNRVWYV